MTIPQTYATAARNGPVAWAITSSARVFIKADERLGRLNADDGPDSRTSRRDAMDACGMAARADRIMEPVPLWQFADLFVGGEFTEYIFDWMHGDHTDSRARRYGPGAAYILRKTCRDMQDALDDMRAT